MMSGIAAEREKRAKIIAAERESLAAAALVVPPMTPVPVPQPAMVTLPNGRG